MKQNEIGFGAEKTNFKVSAPKPDRKPQIQKQPSLPSRKPAFDQKKDDRISKEEIERIKEQVKEQKRMLDAYRNIYKKGIFFLYDVQEQTKDNLNRKKNPPIR